MPAKGGASPYRKGANAERRAKKVWEAADYLCVRSPQSGSPFDLMCAPRGSGVYLVQMKSKNYLRPAEREALLELEDWGLPVLAWIEDGHVRCRDLRGGEIATPETL